MLICVCGYGHVLCDVWMQHGVAHMCPRLPIDASAAYRENGPSLADKMDMENEHECEVSIDNDDTSSTRVETASTDADRTRMDRRSLNRYAKELDSIGLAVPQVTAVMNALREAGIPTGKDATTVEEAKEELLRLYMNR